MAFLDKRGNLENLDPEEKLVLDLMDLLDPRGQGDFRVRREKWDPREPWA